MSLVDPAFQFPADWLRCPMSIGMIRDGHQLRIWMQPRKGEGSSAVVSVADWQSGDCAVRREVEDHIKNGALVVAGLMPERGLVRECRSPLNQSAKSAEIWPSLLDALLPFPLEECAVAFLPAVPLAEGGMSCVAAAARNTDLEEAMAEWGGLGVVPDLLIPEVLLLSDPPESRVWMGETRCVYTAWQDQRFLGAGGSPGLPPENKPFSRFKTTWTSEIPELAWTPLGPSAGQKASVLEENAARTLFQKNSGCVNLLENRENGRIQNLLRRKRRSLCGVGLLMLFLLLAFPLWIKVTLRGAQQKLQAEIGREYVRITGEESPAIGQEVLLAGRVVEDSMQSVSQALDEVTGPLVSVRLHRVLRELQAAGLALTRVEAGTDQLSAVVLGDEQNVKRVQRGLERYGDEVELNPVNQGTWRMEVKAQ